MSISESLGKLSISEKQEDTVPIIDIGPFLSGKDKEGVAKLVDDACRYTGFFMVTNHGISESLLKRIFKAANDFFSLPLEEKLRCKGSHNRGYTEYGEENLTTNYPELNKDVVNKHLGDYKEGIDFGREFLPGDPELDHPWRSQQYNRWPSTLGEEWKSTLREYFKELSGLGHLMMRIFATALHLKEDFFLDKCSRTTSSMRLLHYPPVEDPGRLGCGAHSDYGCLTLLAQDGVSGLQLLNPHNKTFVDVPSIPGAFVVNIGDAMRIWTNNSYVSTVHRVLNPKNNHRFSVPFFFDPNFDLVIECLESCKSEDRPPLFPPILFGDHLEKMYSTTFLDERKPEQAM
eukprot:TRINITY_DN5403_c0_g1_i1.p1 TRINITY_DN5403_c0_g1~~TRINITY_DN5403_c0_g1_i1.p1  ORF type:complete len:345 (-),score=52.02 TRINITY_DN5403_c0_g1_i1:148-1182(-)